MIKLNATSFVFIKLFQALQITKKLNTEHDVIIWIKHIHVSLKEIRLRNKSFSTNWAKSMNDCINEMIYLVRDQLVQL